MATPCHTIESVLLHVTLYKILILSRAVNLDSRVQGLAGPVWTRGPGPTSKDSSDSLKAWKLLYRTRESTGTRESKGGESASPKGWTRSSTNSKHLHVYKIQNPITHS